MKSLRVLHIYRTYFPETQGGAQEAIRQICLATREFEVENTIFTLAHRPEPAFMELPEAHLVRARSWFELASCDFGAWTALRRCRAAADACDIVQIHFPWPFADMLLPFILRRGQPLLVTYHSDIVRQGFLQHLYAPLRRYLLGRATALVATSPAYAATSEILSDYQAKLHTIPLCLQVQQAADADRMVHWASEFGQNFFLFVGVLRYYKGLNFLIAAATRIKANILILGDGPEGDQLRQEVAVRELRNVYFLGALPDTDKHALIALCRAVVFPSHLRSEAFGMVLLEGAQASKPLVTCEIGTGTTWVNVDGVTGLAVPPEDPEALANAINTLAADDALCVRLGQGARLRWEQQFTPHAVGLAYRQLYDNLLADAAAVSAAPAV